MVMGQQASKQYIIEFPQPNIYVFESYKKANKFLQKAFKDPTIKLKSRDTIGTIWHWDQDIKSDIKLLHKPLFVIILPYKTCKGRLEDLMNVIAHECSHAVDFWIEWLDIEKVDTELRAYMLGALVQFCIERLKCQKHYKNILK